MSLIRLALERPYTFVVIAIMIALLGIWQITKSPKDVFPDIDMPIVSIVWTYAGLPAEEFSQRITTNSEIYLSNYVTGIDHMESQTLSGLCIIRLFFHANIDIQSAIGQATSISQTVLKRMPVGVTPPEILLYSPSTVPVIQLAISSDVLTEEELLDYTTYRIRPQIAALQGVTVPQPYGGRVRELVVDAQPTALQARGLSTRALNAKVNTQSFVLPTGDVRIGNIDYLVNLNNTPLLPEEYNKIPLGEINGSMIFLQDVAYAHDGFAPQVNVVHAGLKRAVLLTILKNGSTSTLEIVDQVKKMLPYLKAAAPQGMEMDLLFDQSLFVRAALKGMVTEALLAGALTGVLILFFLSSWRSMLIIVLIIPLSLLAAIVALGFMGYSLNLMTLGGFTLAIGILVDCAIVCIENVHRHLKSDKLFKEIVIVGTSQIILPAFVSTLAICIVFLPISLLSGPSRFLFIPFAFAVVFAIVASFFLAFTLLPVLIYHIEKSHAHKREKRAAFTNLFRLFNLYFARFKRKYSRALRWSLDHPLVISGTFALLFLSPLLLLSSIGKEFFPTVDAGQLKLHVYLPTGTRLEVTSAEFGQIGDAIRQIIPPDEIELLVNNIGVPISPFSLAFGDTTSTGSWDGTILIALKPSRSTSTESYMQKLRQELREVFPDYTFLFQPADMIGQILNFGLPTPIDIRLIGYGDNNVALAREIVQEVSAIPGLADVRLHQLQDQPELFLSVDRIKSMRAGLTQLDIAQDVVIACSDSTYVSPNFWLDHKMATPYPIAVQTPKYRINSVDDLLRMPISSLLPGPSQLLANFASIERKSVPGVISHHNIQPALDIYANVQGRDLGSAANEIQKIIHKYEKQLKPGNKIILAGMVQDMNYAFERLILGFAAAFILVYLILVINFQSWLDAFIIIMALPGALAGVVWLLFLSYTHFSVPALMGAIVSLGVATANSVLVVVFANKQMHIKSHSAKAVHTAASMRLRPVIMTALAMVVGTIPMALAIGEGGEQNAPLGRALIGGIIFATITTLIFVPVLFACMRKKPNPYISAQE